MVHVHHDIHDTYICQKTDSQNVKESNDQLLRIKTRFLNRWNPGKFDPKFQQTRSQMRYDFSKKKLRLMLQNFGLQRPRGPTRLIICFCFCSLFRKRRHCGNKLFPVSVSVILTEKPIAGCTLSFREISSCTNHKSSYLDYQELCIWVLYRCWIRGLFGPKFGGWIRSYFTSSKALLAK